MPNYSEEEPAPLDLTLKIADSFCVENPGIIFCLEEEQFYLYKNGFYVEIFDREMKKIILDKKIQVRQKPVYFLNNVMERIGTNVKARINEFNTGEYLNFDNGLFDIRTNEFKEHSPKVISTIRLPYKYDKDAVCPLWEKSLNEIMENDKNKVNVLQEFFGYCLTREVKYEKAMILTGDGMNGKSTILDTLEKIVGKENCSALSLRYFSDSQKASILINKMVNICGEVPKKVEDYEAEFKTIVSGEPLLINPKFVPAYTLRPFCKLIMALNEFPYIDDRTSAFYRRLLVIELNKKFQEEEQNKNLKKALEIELSGIFNWAVIGWKRLEERGTFLIDKYMKATIETIKKGNNPILQWTEEHIEFVKGTELIKSDAYEHYKIWCLKNGYKPAGSNKFGAEIFKIFHEETEKNRRQGEGKRHYIWPNLMLRDGYIKQEPVTDWEDTR